MKQEKDLKEKDFEETKDVKKSGKGKGKGKPYKGKGKDKASKGNINDSHYYYTDPNVLASVTNFSFTEFQGVPVDLGAGRILTTDTGDTLMRENVANVIAFRMNPSVQPTAAEGSTGSEAINAVALRNYTGMTAGNGKTSQYAQSDPMMATLAIGSAVTMYSHIKRAFNSYMLVNQRNREYPRLLFRAMGIDFDDFKKNIANYRDQFNLTICQFDKIPMFDSITYLEKCKHMYENIYVDEQSPLAQTYMFVPYSVWVLDEAYDPSGSGLVTMNLYEDRDIMTMQELIEIFALQITRLTTSSTLNYVYSDILRLISSGKGNSFMLDTIPMYPDPKFGPVINDEIRHWINNAMIVGSPVAKDALPAVVSRGSTNYNDVCSDGDTGCVLYHPTFLLDQNANPGSTQPDVEWIYKTWYDNNLVNFDSMIPTIEDKVASLRLAVRANVLSISDSGIRYTYTNDIDLGDFYCVDMLSWTDDTESYTKFYGNIVLSNGTTSLAEGYMKRCDILSKLKYAPRFAYFTPGHLAAGGTNMLKSMEGDLTYYTLIDHDLTKRIKDAEMYGLFDYRL